MPAGVQAQVDWAHFPSVMVGGSERELLALHMVLSFSRKAAVVWAESKDMLAWIGCHTACFQRLGGVPATVWVDNEKCPMGPGPGAPSTRPTVAMR
jgi:transposase